MAKKAKLVGINHVALTVGDIDAALDFYGAIFDFELRGEGSGSAFLDMGDQFLALMEGGDEGRRDKERHFGLVVDDRESVRALAESAGAEILATDSVDFLDPWGNRVQVIDYSDIQFSKTEAVLRALGLKGLGKSEEARQQLRDKGMLEKG